MDSEPFVVLDAKTGDDLTRSILLQIILEEEANGSPMFTAPVLANIIRFYGHAMQGFMGGYLEKNMQSLMDVQARMSEPVRDADAGHVEPVHDHAVTGGAGHDGLQSGAVQGTADADAGTDAEADRPVAGQFRPQALNADRGTTIQE